MSISERDKVFVNEYIAKWNAMTMRDRLRYETMAEGDWAYPSMDYDTCVIDSLIDCALAVTKLDRCPICDRHPYEHKEGCPVGEAATTILSSTEPMEPW